MRLIAKIREALKRRQARKEAARFGPKSIWKNNEKAMKILEQVADQQAKRKDK